MEKLRIVSACCNEAVVVRGEGMTYWYECIKCGKACNVREDEADNN